MFWERIFNYIFIFSALQQEDSPVRNEEKKEKDFVLSPNNLGEKSPLKEEKERLIEAHLARKKVEEDALLLANRIALLEAEDKKINKKIEETRKKALEIRDLKLRNKDTEQMKKEVFLFFLPYFLKNTHCLTRPIQKREPC